MKLQKRLSRVYKSKKYYKYMLVIPEIEVKKANFAEGDELILESKKDRIIIKKPNRKF